MARREISTWAQTKIQELLSANNSLKQPNPKVIYSLIENGGLFKASPQAKSKYNAAMVQIFGLNYRVVLG